MSTEDSPLEDLIAAINEKHKDCHHVWKPNVHENPDGRLVEFYIENVPYYAVWDHGTGHGCAIYRAQDDDRIIGGAMQVRKDFKWGVYPLNPFNCDVDGGL